MITNEVQYRSTRSHLARFEQAIADLERAEVATHERKLHDLQLSALRSQAAGLRSELDEYDMLRSGEVTTFEAASLPGLAEVLVKARIARGWTQRRLAGELGVAEQQVQRYESTGYASASLARLSDVVAALDVDVSETVSLRGTDAA